MTSPNWILAILALLIIILGDFLDDTSDNTVIYQVNKKNLDSWKCISLKNFWKRNVHFSNLMRYFWKGNIIQHFILFLKFFSRRTRSFVQRMQVHILTSEKDWIWWMNTVYFFFPHVSNYYRNSVHH